jgi:hypothetical protein
MTFSRAIVTAGLALGCLATTFPAEASAAQTVARGAVVSSTLVEKLDKGQIAERLKAAGIDSAQVKYGVSAYRVVYRTVDAKGRSTTASQLVALPDNGRRYLRVVSWLHGTTVYRGDVASVNEKSTDRAVALLFAGAGHAVSAPTISAWARGPATTPTETRGPRSPPRWTPCARPAPSPGATSAGSTRACWSAASHRAVPRP